MMPSSSSSRDCNSSYNDDASSRKADDESFHVDGDSDYEDEICVDDDDVRPEMMQSHSLSMSHLGHGTGRERDLSPPSQSTPLTSPLSSPVFPGQPINIMQGRFYTQMINLNQCKL